MSVTSVSRMIRRRIAFALMTLGVAGLVVGVIGRTSWEPESVEDIAAASTDVAASPSTTSTAPTTTVPLTNTSVPTTTVPSTTTTAPTTTVPAQESVEDFVVVLATAMAATDVDTLTARLHPEVLARYGDEQCRAYVATQGDPSFALEFVEAGDAGVWNYATDALTTDVPDTFTATVDQIRAGEIIRREIHFAHFEGEIRWFTDCGAPVS